MRVCVRACVRARVRVCVREKREMKNVLLSQVSLMQTEFKTFSVLQKRRRIRRRSVRAVRQQKAALVFGFILSNGSDAILIKLSQAESHDVDTSDKTYCALGFSE